MATTFTPIYAFDLPAVGDTGWGPLRNGNMTDVDQELARMRVPFLSPTIGATTTLDLNQATGARVFLLTVTQITTLAFTNVPAATFAVRWHLRLTNGAAFAVTFPAAVVWLNGMPTFRTSGVDWVEFWTTDGGTTVYARLMNGSVYAPRTNVDAGTGANTGETTLHTVAVPAGAMGANGALDITVIFAVTGTANTKTINLKFGGTTFASVVFAAGDTGNAILTFTIANQNNVAVQIGAGIRHVPASGLATMTGHTAGAINTAVAQNVTVTGTTPNAADEITIKSTIVRVLPS